MNTHTCGCSLVFWLRAAVLGHLVMTSLLGLLLCEVIKAYSERKRFSFSRSCNPSDAHVLFLHLVCEHNTDELPLIMTAPKD